MLFFSLLFFAFLFFALLFYSSSVSPSSNSSSFLSILFPSSPLHFILSLHSYIPLRNVQVDVSGKFLLVSLLAQIRLKLLVNSTPITVNITEKIEKCLDTEIVNSFQCTLNIFISFLAASVFCCSENRCLGQKLKTHLYMILKSFYSAAYNNHLLSFLISP